LNQRFNYNWNLKDGYPSKGITKHSSKVFGTFICGGGSTMGYKRAGYNHLGGVEIDDTISKIYDQNHKPKYLFKEDLRQFKNRTDLPYELLSLDILDGSPPCSSFSMAGNREDDWGKEKIFNEGQSLQTLDDLFFDFIDLADKLQPKVIVSENVTGLVCGNAKSYVHEICARFSNAGYQVQIFRLNAASMGVPQRRERIFFICRRIDLQLPRIELLFKEGPVLFDEVERQIPTAVGKPLSEAYAKWWRKSVPGKPLSKVHPKGSFFNSYKTWSNQVCPTITASEAGKLMHHTEPAELHEDALKLCGSFPMDYDFMNVLPKYLIGMSVPPVMMAQISNQIYIQWLSKLN
jgi:DNA (cytosine-5)-methyltransferase 1